MSCLLADAIVVTCFRIFIFESIIEIITTIIYKLEVVWCVAGIEKRYVKESSDGVHPTRPFSAARAARGLEELALTGRKLPELSAWPVASGRRRT